MITVAFKDDVMAMMRTTLLTLGKATWEIGTTETQNTHAAAHPIPNACAV